MDSNIIDWTERKGSIDMVIGIIGENCTGKSTLAEEIQRRIGGEIVTGKDYMRLAKSEAMAAALFKKQLKEAVAGDTVLYVISEPEHVKLLPEGAVRVLVKADIDTIKERFKARMRGDLPAPVAEMLERKHGMFDAGTYDYTFNSDRDDLICFCDTLAAALSR